MRTFGILLGGWVTGAAAVVLLSGTGVPPSARAEERRPSAASPSPLAPVEATRFEPATSGGAASRGPILIPVHGVTARELRDTFSQARGGGRTHRAMDILAPKGTPVLAAVDGTIRKLFNSRGGGITIYQFDADQQRVYYYAHLDRYADGLAEGQVVQQGDVIGFVGTTGNAPPGTPHLHFSVEDLPPTKEWWKGSPVNPYPLLTGAGVTSR